MIARILIVLLGIGVLVAIFELRDRLEEYGERMSDRWMDDYWRRFGRG